MLYHRHETLVAPDGHDIHTQLWAPDGQASCVIQILHGLGEHSGRYARLAGRAVERGLAVCIHDHRGHGNHCDDLGHFADSGGWQKVVSDSEVVNVFVQQQFAGTPIVLLGHSMGSYIAQTFAMHYGSRLSGLILSASSWPSRLQLVPAKLLARIEALRIGRRGKSELLHKLGFGDFNKPFEPARTDLDWLSRDEAEVDKYVSDPLCGGPYSCGLWLDLLGGLFDLASEKVKIYAEGRHEMLNETNRDEVTADWLDWVSVTTGSGR